ncbi:hypothetical protein [Actinoalloteichus fjordicus]|nr:hypothetical protein [Actinoalloteichus fjordicus]
MGDTHLGWIELRASSVVVWPACARRRFVALNRWPIDECYYDDQPCADCLAILGPPTSAPPPPPAALSVVPAVVDPVPPCAVVPEPRRALAVIR